MEHPAPERQTALDRDLEGTSHDYQQFLDSPVYRDFDAYCRGIFTDARNSLEVCSPDQLPRFQGVAATCRQILSFFELALEDLQITAERTEEHGDE